MRGPHPPRLAAWLVERALPEEEAQRLLGDLDEEYFDFQRSRRGRWTANLWYWRQTLASAWILRPRRRRAVTDVRMTMREGEATMDSIVQDVR